MRRRLAAALLIAALVLPSLQSQINVRAPQPDLINGQGSNGTGVVVACDTQAKISTATISDTLIVTGVAGKNIYICGISFSSAGTTTVALETSAASSCTTPTTITGAYRLIAGSAMAYGTGLGTVLRTTAAGQSLCINNTVAIGVGGVVTYAQF